MTTMTLEAAWALLVRDRFGLQALGTTRLRTDPEAAGRVLAMVAPREHRGVVEQVLGAAAELAVGQPGEALRSLRAAREAGVSLAVLDRALADIGLDGEGPMRSTGTPRPATWLLTAALQAAAVGRVHAAGGGRFYGSGVLVDAGLLVPEAAGRPALLTCAHVCTDAPGPLPSGWPTPLAAAEAEVWFPGFPAGEAQVIGVTGALWRAQVAGLDACLLALAAPPAGIDAVSATAEAVYPLDSQVYLMGYPGGGELAISMEQSTVETAEDGRMTYGLAGQPGASGGPVFHWADLRLAGLHRGDLGDDRQGVLLAALIEAASG